MPGSLCRSYLLLHCSNIHVSLLCLYRILERRHTLMAKRKGRRSSKRGVPCPFCGTHRSKSEVGMKVHARKCDPKRATDKWGPAKVNRSSARAAVGNGRRKGRRGRPRKMLARGNLGAMDLSQLLDVRDSINQLVAERGKQLEGLMRRLKA